ncbi:hypothetical protein GJ496_008423 [Pomphorhynchus laevis]|nr:hypothetical protein GJ496_008423 [Pomphorhynchus laevis]
MSNLVQRELRGKSDGCSVILPQIWNSDLLLPLKKSTKCSTLYGPNHKDVVDKLFPYSKELTIDEMHEKCKQFLLEYCGNDRRDVEHNTDKNSLNNYVQLYRALLNLPQNKMDAFELRECSTFGASTLMCSTFGALKDLRETQLQANLTKNWMQHLGLNIFCDFDTIETTHRHLKNYELEKVTCFQIAMICRGCLISWSKWNTVVRADNLLAIEIEYDYTQQHSSTSNDNEKDSETVMIIPGQVAFASKSNRTFDMDTGKKTFANLYQLAATCFSQTAMSRINEMSTQTLTHVWQFLHLFRPFEY